MCFPPTDIVCFYSIFLSNILTNVCNNISYSRYFINLDSISDIDIWCNCSILPEHMPELFKETPTDCIFLYITIGTTSHHQGIDETIISMSWTLLSEN